MKRLLFALCLTLTVLLSPALQAQNLTPEDREKAVKYLEKTRAALLEATKGLSEAQWSFKQAPDRWSVAEVTEHIAAAEDFLMGMILEKVMKAPARTEADDVKALDELVLQRIPDRTSKVQAPEPLRPSNKFGSPKESLKHFTESRAKTIEFVKITKDLRQHATDSPLGKKLDGYQWVLFIGAHSERHTKQLNEVKADPNFPKK
ncbi:MAG: DinB family protein [Opitutaceae bacterium]|nr:DinB family protein [Verrucomicrobiales bacterium]